MALALQMAAVNHSIMALVNQHREEIMEQEERENEDSDKGEDDVCSSNDFNNSNVSREKLEMTRDNKPVIAPSPIQA